ncbi:MAG: hypothetical protein ACREUG_13205 [Steroidobacteraceae bacterium]
MHLLILVSPLTLAASLGLFIATAAQRLRIGGRAAARLNPEKRWTYDQHAVLEFIEALRRSSGTGADASARRLGDYRSRVLRLDIGFALSFSAFIVLTSLLLAHWPGASPWLTGAGTTLAGFGVLYGACDVGEDIKLIQTLSHAERLLPLHHDGKADPDAPALADAAQVDAANVLTRLKFITFWASLFGLIVLTALARFLPH